MNYTIGITTFDKRFNEVVTLISNIRQYSMEDIILCINGNHNENFNEEYRKNILQFCASQSNIYPVMFTELRGLSKTINTIFINSKNENVLILNDDINITDSIFFEDLNAAFNQLENLCRLSTTWYASFSHFIAKKTFWDEIGYYDERLLGFGEEDGDMVWRYIQKYGKDVPNFSVRGLEHHNLESRQNNIKPGVGKYSLFNRKFMFEDKYNLGQGTISGMFHDTAIENNPITRQYPYEKYFLNNKDQL